MKKLIVVLSIIALSSPVFAQGSGGKPKKSCNEYCAQYCANSSGHRNFCYANCPARCEQKRSQQKG